MTASMCGSLITVGTKANGGRRYLSSAIVRSVIDGREKFPGVEVEVEGRNGSKKLRFPYCYLRDNCSSNFHKHTWQRLTAVNAQVVNIQGTSVVADNHLDITWSERVPNDKEPGEYLADVSRFSAEWYFSPRHGSRAQGK